MKSINYQTNFDTFLAQAVLAAKRNRLPSSVVESLHRNLRGLANRGTIKELVITEPKENSRVLNKFLVLDNKTLILSQNFGRFILNVYLSKLDGPKDLIISELTVLGPTSGESVLEFRVTTSVADAYSIWAPTLADILVGLWTWVSNLFRRRKKGIRRDLVSKDTNN